MKNRLRLHKIYDLDPQDLPRHAVDKKKLEYMACADSLFVKSSQLKEHTYLWAMAWKPSDVGACEELGPTWLAFLNYVLIGITGKVPSELLHFESAIRSSRSQYTRNTWCSNEKNIRFNLACFYIGWLCF